ncbi:hypothetical protein ACTMU2_00075 [Cupriavidus basilensis]
MLAAERCHGAGGHRAGAQSAGSNIVSASVGFRVMPNGSADPLTVDSINGRPVGMARSEHGRERRDPADTLGLAFEHYFTDNISMARTGRRLRFPPKHDVKGTGEFRRPTMASLVRSQAVEPGRGREVSLLRRRGAQIPSPMSASV